MLAKPLTFNTPNLAFKFGSQTDARLILAPMAAEAGTSSAFRPASRKLSRRSLRQTSTQFGAKGMVLLDPFVGIVCRTVREPTLLNASETNRGMVTKFRSKKRDAMIREIWEIVSMHKTIEPSILYFGTPVVLISTRNEDGTTNVSPMSSAWFLGWGCMIGLGSSSKTPENLLREQECVLNLPSVDQADAVNRLAKTTGSNPVPASKLARDYRHVKDKLCIAGLTTLASELVQPPRIAECPVQMEAVLQAAHPFGGFAAQRSFGAGLEKAAVTAFELKILRVHVNEVLLLAGKANHVDPDKWKPIIMSFARFYGLADGQILPSTLAEIPEELYRPAEHMGDSRQAVSALSLSE